MSEDSDRFRLRAKECRELAKLARDEHSRKTLSQMSQELDEESARIEDEERSDLANRGDAEPL